MTDKKEKKNIKHENLTHSLGIVLPDAKPVLKTGYDKVIYTKKGELKKIMREATHDSLGFFTSSYSYNCYDVSTDGNLEFDFETEIRLREQFQWFTLKSIVYYKVDDPGKIAGHFSSDPMKRIRKYIEDQLKDYFSKNDIQIERIMSHFQEVEEDARKKIWKEIFIFAAVYGISIEKISLSCKIPDEYWDVLKKKRELEQGNKKLVIKKDELEKELKEMRLAHTKEIEAEILRRKIKMEENLTQQQQNDFKRSEEGKDTSQQQQDKLFDIAVLGGIEKLKDQVDSPENFTKSAKALMQTVKDYFGLNEHFNQAQIGAGSGKQAHALPRFVEGPYHYLRTLLVDIIRDVDNESFPDYDKKTLIAYATHVLAELYLEKEANPDIVLDYKEKFSTTIASGEALPLGNFLDRINELDTKLKNIFPQAYVIDIEEGNEK